LAKVIFFAMNYLQIWCY